jgi:DNA-binding NtrC family response regulator
MDASKRREILVVDDLPEIGDFFRALMRRMKEFDIHLTTEINSERALSLVKENKYDLILSDFRMRQVDGVEVLSVARGAHPEGLRILMTGYNEIPTSMERIKQAGVDAYVQKPLRSQDILLLIFDFLNRNENALEAYRREARDMERMGVGEERRPVAPVAPTAAVDVKKAI